MYKSAAPTEELAQGPAICRVLKEAQPAELKYVVTLEINEATNRNSVASVTSSLRETLVLSPQRQRPEDLSGFINRTFPATDEVHLATISRNQVICALSRQLLKSTY